VCLKNKQYTWVLDHNFGKCRLEFFHGRIPKDILYMDIIKILHRTLNVFLHYLVKLENCNCCRFQWRIAYQATDFILRDIKPPQ